jgi:hypothetical protein
MRVSDARYSRDLRRYELAWKLIGFDVRTRVIERWAGLSTYRIRTLYRAYAAGDPSTSGSPLRGVPPTQVRFFWRSAQIRCEAAILAGFLRAYDLLPAGPIETSTGALPSLARGERLCRAYAEFRALSPSTPITMEHVMLLLSELVRGEEIALGHCTTCRTLVLVDRLAIAPPRCAYCAYDAQAGLSYADAVNKSQQTGGGKDESGYKPAPPDGGQGSLF